MKQLRISEIYKSLQGEGLRVGLPCIFIRLTGCDLRCQWCDTAFAFEGGELFDESTLIKRIHDFDTKRLEFTGGEPMLQIKAMLPLIEKLLEDNYEILIETGGHHDLSPLPKSVVKIMDIKCPASNESKKNLMSNLSLLTAKDEVKFVIADRADFNWACAHIKSHSEILRFNPLFSPAWGLVQPEELAEWILASGLDVRLQLPLHKILWGEERRR